MNHSDAAKKMIIVLIGWLIWMSSLPAAASTPEQKVTVILMHGILGRPIMMKRIE